MSVPPAPDPGLRAAVVVPARDEEQRVAACLEALAGQEGIAAGAFEVLLVLDDCGDGTAEEARRVARRHPELELHLLEGPRGGVGPARRLGMDLACARLTAVGRSEGLIASTDADSVVAPDWLTAQLEAAERGARAIGGRIVLCPRELALLPPGVAAGHAAQGRRRHARVRAEDAPGSAEHWQFSGASMAVTAATYAEVGGLDPLPALEDEALERALRRHGVPIERSLAVRVTTSARVRGRARRGLADDLGRALEREQREESTL